MSCKKPILLSIDGVSRELIEEAHCGIYAEPENEMAIINAIQEFYTMETRKLRQLGENGYAYARNNFDRDILSKKYLGLMKSII